jgi:hypothetical protein
LIAGRKQLDELEGKRIENKRAERGKKKNKHMITKVQDVYYHVQDMKRAVRFLY